MIPRTLLVVILYIFTSSLAMAQSENTKAIPMSKVKESHLMAFVNKSVRIYSEMDYKDMTAKLGAVRAISTGGQYAKYKSSLSPGSVLRSKIESYEVRAKVSSMGAQYQEGSTYLRRFLVPVIVSLVTSKNSEVRNQIASISIILTMKGLKVANYSVIKVFH